MAAAGAVGMTGAVMIEGRPVPLALVARTVKVYAAPLVKPVTAHVRGPLCHVQLAPPGDAVTV